MPTLGNICERHIAEAETTLDIPRQLLLAISVVESGVWDEARRRSTPRPWTVYAQKRGRRLANKAEALAEGLLHQQGSRHRHCTVLVEDLRPSWWVQVELLSRGRLGYTLEHALVVGDAVLGIVNRGRQHLPEGLGPVPLQQ